MNELEYIGEIVGDGYYEPGGMRIGKHSFREIVDDIEAYFYHEDIIHVSYYISDVELNKKQFLENHLLYLFGDPELECSDVHGSEWTGYMWTNQEFKIGGHDLVKELSDAEGKFCYLKIYNNKEKRDMSIDNLLKINK